jgi:hypothetical protein
VKRERLEISRLNKHEQRHLKLDNLRSLVIQLPLVIAERPFDTSSVDFLFVQACNLIHKRQYHDAVNLFNEALLHCRDAKCKEMILFNMAYALYKLNPADPRPREIWQTQITDHSPYFKALAHFNVATLSYLYDLRHASNRPSVNELDKLHKCTQDFDTALLTIQKMAHTYVNPQSKKAL